MCTLEPLGYASNQYFTIPYLVLNKSIQQNLNNHSEAMDQVIELVQQTASNMIAQNATFKQQIVDQLIGFVQGAQNRTADVIADIGVLTSQAWSYAQLPEEQRQLEAADPQAA